MKNLLFLISLFLLQACIKPEQEAVEFGLTIKPMAGVNKESITKEDIPLLVNYKVKDSEDSIDLTVKLTQQPKYGTLNSCKHLSDKEIQCIYVPNQDFFGKDRIGFRAKDGDFFSDESSYMEITITPVPDKPVGGVVQKIELAENTSKSFEAKKSSDVDSEDLKYEIVDSVAHGSISNCLSNDNEMNCEYTPDENFYGADSFTYKTIDETGLISDDVNTVNIKVLNVPEMGVEKSITVDQYSNVVFDVVKAIDPDSSDANMSYKIFENPSKGKLDKCFLGKGLLSCEYTPNYGALGIDSFKYKAVDDAGLESLGYGVINITINKVDLPPVPAPAQTISVLQNGSKIFTVNAAKDNDSDDNTLKYEIVNLPKYGILSNCLYLAGNPNNRGCTYKPNLQYNGTDSFTYKVTDDTGVTSKNPGLINITVQKVYQKPVVGANQTIKLNQGSPKVFYVTAGTDVDTVASKLQYAIVSSPKNGALTNCFASLGSTACTFVPNKTFTGSDSFTYKIIDDKQLQSGIATVSFSIIPRISPIIGPNIDVGLIQFESKLFKVIAATDADTEQYSLTYKVVTNPKNGVLSECFIQVGDLNCTYKPNTDFYGEDKLVYKVVDDYGLESTNGEITFAVNPKEKPVPSVTDAYTTPEYTQVDFTVTAAVDGDSPASSLVYRVTTQPKNGLLKNCFLSTGHHGCQYQPNNKFYGTDSFTYSVTDEYGLVSATEGLVTFTVEKRSPPVVGVDLTASTKQNIGIYTNASEGSDDDTPVNELVYKVDTLPTHGNLTECFSVKGDRKCKYTPDSNYYGSDSFTYKITDSYGLISVTSATITIQIEKVATKPTVGANQVFNIDKNKVKVFDVSLAVDPDSAAELINYKIQKNTTNGTLTNCFVVSGSRSCTYTPGIDFTGIDSFMYNVTDETGLISSGSGTIYFNIIKVNNSPRVGDDQLFNIQQGTNLTFNVNLGTDLDSAGSLLKYTIVQTPTNGSLTSCFLVSGSVQCTYMPDSKFYGTDFFTYKIIDNTGYESEVTAKVTFNVIKREAPVPHSQTISFKQYTNITFTVTEATDADSSAGSLKYDIVTSPANGTISNCFITNGYTGCTYTPNPKYYGTDSFTYKVTDEYGIESVNDGKVSIIITKVDLIPTIGADQSFQFDQDLAKTFSVSKAVDEDSADNEITYKVEVPPTNGVIDNCFAAAGDLSCRYTPTLYWSGNDSFTYSATDSTGKKTAATAKVSFIVNKVNKPPAVGSNQSIGVIKNSSRAFTVSPGADIDGPILELKYTVTSEPANGALSDCFLTVGIRTCKYTPIAGYYGTDSFEYKVVDITSLSSPTVAKVTFNVTVPLERPVVGGAITVSLIEGSSKLFTVPMATDADSFSGDLIYSKHTDSSAGTISNCFSGAGVRTCTYTPTAGYNGTDSFTYKVTDETNLTSTSAGVVNFIMTGTIYSGEENFTQTQTLKGVDFTWIVDNSSSMRNDQNTLKNSFDSFINKFIVNGKAPYPFNMLVTTTDSIVQKSYIGKLTSAKAESDITTFKANFRAAVDVGTKGSMWERAIKAAHDARTTQSEFYQGNDTLAVYIIVSDAWERSSSKYIHQWASIFHATKDNAAKVRFYHIIDGDIDNRHKDMAALTGGATYSISENFDAAMDSIGTKVTSLLDSFLLNGGRKIKSDSIKVYINNSLIAASEYTYGMNSITFKTPPASNASIKITYDYTTKFVGP